MYVRTLLKVINIHIQHMVITKPCKRKSARFSLTHFLFLLLLFVFIIFTLTIYWLQIPVFMVHQVGNFASIISKFSRKIKRILINKKIVVKC